MAERITDDEAMQKFSKFLESYTPREPNMWERIGTGLSGFAAPFLGQEWEDPYAQQGRTINPMMLYLMKDMFNKQSNVGGVEQLKELIGNNAGEGLGITGASYDPNSGEVKLNIGETPQAKEKREQSTAVSKKMMEEEVEWKSSKALLKSLKEDWLATNPPRAGMLGIGGAGILPQPLYGIHQRIGSTIQLTKNQRADAKYYDRLKGLQSRLAKGIIGKDIGNLAYQEQLAVRGSLGTLGDAYETGIAKFNAQDKMMDEMYAARKEGYKNVVEKWEAEGRVLTKEKAMEYLKKAGGDPVKARILATMDRWAIPGQENMKYGGEQ